MFKRPILNLDMDNFKNSDNTEVFHTLGIVPVIKVPDFVDFNTVYEFRGFEYVTFKIVKSKDDNIARVMDLGGGKMSASSLIDSIDSENTIHIEERTD